MNVRILFAFIVILVAMAVANPATEGQITRFNIFKEDGLSKVNAYILEGSGYSMPGLEESKLYICIEQNNYEVGDIVAYNKLLGNTNKIIGHRILEKQGDRFFIAGDFYQKRGEWVQKSQIICRLIPEPIS